MTLNDLAKGGVARIAEIQGLRPDLEAKLREIGFSEGDEVELLTRGPFGGQPLAVRLNRRIIALRGTEAQAVRLEREP
jgi:ferrous iron transport protein A